MITQVTVRISKHFEYARKFAMPNPMLYALRFTLYAYEWHDFYTANETTYL